MPTKKLSFINNMTMAKRKTIRFSKFIYLFNIFILLGIKGVIVKKIIL